MVKYTIYLLFVLMPVVIGMYKKVYRSKNDWPFFAYSILCIITETVLVFTSMAGQQNHWVINFFLPIETTLVCWQLNNWISNKNIRLAIKITVGLFVLSCVVLNFFLDSKHFLAQLLTINHLIIAFFAGYFLVSFVGSVDHFPLKDYKFWVATGLFLFFLCTTIIHSSTALLYKNENPEWFSFYYIVITNSFNFLSYSLYIFAYLCYIPQKKLERYY